MRNTLYSFSTLSSVSFLSGTTPRTNDVSMTTYTWYNLAFAAIILPLSNWLVGQNRRWRNLRLAARIAGLLTLLIYPWDFFAIRLGAWTHPSFPGWRIYGVPFNDSLFAWLFTYLARVMLLRFVRKAHRHAES